MLRQAQHDRIWGIHHLMPHPALPTPSIQQVNVQILGCDARSLHLEYSVRPANQLVLPPEGRHGRTDGLWQSTCFEAFIKSPGEDSYSEFNFSPSFDWAAYQFDGYRSGMRDVDLKLDPDIWVSASQDTYFLAAEFCRPDMARVTWLLGPSAVIEETDGTKSYWALAHPPGRPDFHHPACFALELPAAREP